MPLRLRLPKLSGGHFPSILGPVPSKGRHRGVGRRAGRVEEEESPQGTITPGEKRLLDVIREEQKVQADKVKYTVGKLTSAYQKADSTALQNSIISTLKGINTNLPPYLQAAIAPFIEQSPISPAAEKRRQFRESYGDPPERPFGEPTFSTIKDSETGREVVHIKEGVVAMQDQAEYQFAMSDYLDAERRVVFGSTLPVKAKKYIYLGNQQAAVRTDEGQVVLLNAQDIGARELAKKYNVSVKDIWTQGDALPTGDKAVAIVDGKKTTFEQTFNVFATTPEERYGRKVVGIEKAPSGPDIERPKEMNKLLTNIITLNEDDVQAKHFLDLLDEADRDRVAEELQLLWPNYTFVVEGGVSKKGFRTGILDWFYYNTKVSITPIPGRPQTFRDSAGKTWTGSVDNNGVVWNKEGQVKAQSVEDLLRMLDE